MVLTHWFDRTNASHLLFIDADMGFDPRVIVDMIELDQPVVGVIYPKRKFDLTKYEKSLVAGDAPSRARAKALDFAVRGPGVGAQNGFVRVEGCGAGILRLRRDCIATLLDHQPQQSDTSARLTSPTAHGLDRLIRVFDPIRYETVICPRPTPFAIAGGFAETCGPLQTGRSCIWACIDSRAATAINGLRGTTFPARPRLWGCPRANRAPRTTPNLPPHREAKLG